MPKDPTQVSCGVWLKATVSGDGYTSVRGSSHKAFTLHHACTQGSDQVGKHELWQGCYI